MPRTPNTSTTTAANKRKKAATPSTSAQRQQSTSKTTSNEPSRQEDSSSTSSSSSEEELSPMRDLNRIKVKAKQKYAIQKSKRNLRFRNEVSGRILAEIRKLQRSTVLLIPKLPFARLVREITQQYRTDLRYRTDGLYALQESAEDYIIRFLATSYDLTTHRTRKTLERKDMQLLASIIRDL